MIRRSFVLVLVLVLLSLSWAAQEAAGTISKDDTIHSVVQRYVGQKVTVKLGSGDELTGRVEMVGEHVVHLAELSGKEFYDAVIDLDDITAIIFRAREK